MEWIEYIPNHMDNMPLDEENGKYFVVLVNGVDSIAKWLVGADFSYNCFIVRRWDVPVEWAPITHFCKRPKLPNEK